MRNWPMAAGPRRCRCRTATAASLVSPSRSRRACSNSCWPGRPRLSSGSPARGELLLQTVGADGWPATLKPGAAADPAVAAPVAEALLVLAEATGEPAWLAPLARLGDALADHPELRARLAAGLRAPAAERSRTERARLTAARAPGVAEWVGALDGRGHWLVDGRVSVARYVAAMNELLVYLRDYEPLPDFPGNQVGRPPQHRR